MSLDADSLLENAEECAVKAKGLLDQAHAGPLAPWSGAEVQRARAYAATSLAFADLANARILERPLEEGP
jgi:hypothetical protein